MMEDPEPERNDTLQQDNATEHSNSEPVNVEEIKEESDDDEEEDECRVCRGPAEDGNLLFKPCKCSGSIGLTHQECLMSWLEVTRGDGRCELCKTKFHFDPQYAENAPDRLPAHEVFLGLSSRFLAKWLPLAIRIFVAASLWLLIAPLLTACLYHGWMHRPSSVLTRWKREVIPSDIVSGAIIAAVVIISFLSLMSFADFLRVHWQQPARPGEGNGEQQRRDDMANGFNGDNNINNDPQGGIDEAVVEHVELNRPLLETNPLDENPTVEDSLFDLDNGDTDNADRIALESQTTQGHELAMLREARRQNTEDNPNHDMDENIGVGGIDAATNGGMEGEFEHQDHEEDEDSDHDVDPLAAPFIDPLPPARPRDRFHDEDEDDDIIDDDDIDMPDLLPRDDAEPRRNILADDRPFDPMDPVLQDDQGDMEINVALDELLGLRGPITTLIRNLLWLLAFNATYLGIFAFVPKTVGSAVYAGILNTTVCEKMFKSIPYVHSEDPEKMTVLSALSSLNNESSEKDTTFRLPDVTIMMLGYFSIAFMIVMMRYGWVFSEKIRRRFSLEGINTPQRQEANIHHFHARIQPEGDEMMHDFDDRDGMEPVAAGTAIGVALDTIVAVVKVGVLLFLKMFLLPLLLGLWLDASTMPLFGHSISDRTKFAGGDLFSFVLLHWVGGITFMLLVTVFLLQLREVIHPDLLARLIRPQEPQPDLLGNLMHETVLTHMKRMFLSLGIYAPLLTVHVTLPVKLFVISGLGERFTFFHLNFWHIVMPQMQMPLELIIFHLSMLALLERYKNSIGGLQHGWVVFMCQQMGLTEYIVPRSVANFELIGTKNIFLADESESVDSSKATECEIDPFWYELASKQSDIDSFVESNIDNSEDSPLQVVGGESKASGDRVISTSVDFIRLPGPPIEQAAKSADDRKKESLLRTKMGRFRLRRVDTDDQFTPMIEFWRECPGEAIRRPPDGWDDLGAGGAYVQGRWAWGKERKSVVEGSVSERTPFRQSEKQNRPIHLMLKVVALVILSWVAITFTLLGLISTPLAVGRSFYYLFRIPEKYIHDPLAFVIGGCLFFPILSLLIRTMKSGEASIARIPRDLISRFHVPPGKKLLVFAESLLLWILVAPLALGISYEVAVVKSSKWFAREEPLVDVHSLLLCWTVGAAVLNIWAFFAYFSVFTRPFWTNIGNGILEPPIDERAAAGGQNNADARNGVDGNAEPTEEDANALYRGLQGKDGRVAGFFKIWKAVLLGWEWEKVDRTGLLDEFARPIAKQLASALVGSFVAFQFFLNLTPLLANFEQGSVVVPLVGLVERGLFRMVLFRICMTIHVIVQLCSTFRSRLEFWFQAAHEAARDDRYLIGEILMDYNPDDEE